jgi:hypothetical protein
MLSRGAVCRSERNLAESPQCVGITHPLHGRRAPDQSWGSELSATELGDVAPDFKASLIYASFP